MPAFKMPNKGDSSGKSDSKDDSPFFVPSSDTGFTERQKNIFGQFDILEAQHEKVSDPMEIRGPDSDEEDAAASGFTERQNQSLKKLLTSPSSTPSFKKPYIPALKRLGPKQPDYIKNPQKWKKYDLQDVPDVSNSSNSAAAFSFLREIDERKAAEAAASEPSLEEGEDSSKIVFHKPSQKSDRKKSQLKKLLQSEVEDTNSEKASELTSEKSDTKQKKNKPEVKLDHLFEDDEF